MSADRRKPDPVVKRSDLAWGDHEESCRCKRCLKYRHQARTDRHNRRAADGEARVSRAEEADMARAARRRSEGATREQEATDRAYVAEVDRRAAHAQRAVDEVRAALEHVDGDTFKDLDRIRRTLRRVVERNTWQRKTWRH